MGEFKDFDFADGRSSQIKSGGSVPPPLSAKFSEQGVSHHPDGYMIFLAPDKLKQCDEYLESDPYSVKQNIDSSFHQRRIDLTVELVQEALIQCSDSEPQILDIGCGQGHITDRIRQALPGTQLSGMDYSISAIDYAHKHFPEIEFIVADAYEIPYETGFFDVVVCNNIWEHVPDPLFLLNSIKRVLKPGGHIVISTPSRYRLNNLLNVLRGRPVHLMSKYHVTEYTVGQVKEQLAYGGFEVTRALSRPSAAWSLKSNIARIIFSRLIRLIGSHHRLEETIFYLARKYPE